MTFRKPLALLVALAGGFTGFTSGTVSFAQATATPAKPAVSAKPSTAAKTTAARSSVGPKLPPGVPPVHGLLKTAFALRYQDIKIGTGALAESGKLYKVHYTGWLASDGKKFDSSLDHPGAQPFQFPQGRGRVIPGWDQGFEGMKIGGKRRLFIPYQLAYGVMGRPPVIPGKSDLIFDIELVSVDELPTGAPGGRPMPGGMRTPPPTPPAGQPGSAPGSSPSAPANPQAPAKPADPTNPTAVPPPPPQPPPTAPADKPANPAQPNQK